jgi:hypothetical protein
MGEIDRMMWGPTLNLRRVDRVTRAVKAASLWDDAIVKSGLLDFIHELEHEGKTTNRLGDVVADWAWAVEGARDAMAGACVELLAATLVAVGGGHRSEAPDTATPELS